MLQLSHVSYGVPIMQNKNDKQVGSLEMASHQDVTPLTLFWTQRDIYAHLLIHQLYKIPMKL